MARGRNIDEVYEATPDANPDPNGETAAKRVRRPSPEGEVISLEELDQFSNRSRGGIWFERAKWFKDNPGQVKVYKGVSPTTSTHLKRVHGLHAATRNTRDGGKSADLLVGYFPEGYEVPAVFKGRESKN